MFPALQKWCQSMKSETLSLKTIINELNFLRKTVAIQWNVWKKDLLLLATKLTEEIPDPHNAKEHYWSFRWKKHKISKITKK